MTQEKQKSLVRLQQEILNVVWRYVKPQGVLIYSTCTINSRENEKNVEWFLKEHPGFRLESMEQILPRADERDGFFLAKLRKVE